MVDAALWLGGWWRELTAPLALAAALSLLLTNTAAPGEAARFIAAQGRPAARWGVGLLAAVALLALLEIARGALSPGEAALRVALLGVQLALYQHLPATLLAAALAVMVLALDRQGVSLLTRAAEIGERTVVRHGRRAAEASLAAVAALCAAAWAAAVWPDAMRGFAAVDPPDTQRFSYYASFVYRGVPEDAATERREGFEAGYYGLTLPPGASGELVIRLERNPETTVLLRPNFYNRAVADDGRGLTDRRFENALEVSAGEGQAYRPLLANRSVGEVVADEVFDLTPALGASRVYRLRFTARNTTDAPVTVLPALNVNAIPERSAIPQPTFLAAAYAASGAALLYVLLRCAAWSRRAALAGVVSASVPTALMVRVLAEVAGRRAPSGGGGAMDALASLAFDPQGTPIERTAVWAARAGFVALAAWGALAWRRTRGPNAAGHGVGRALPALAAACLLVGTLALDVRWGELMIRRFDYLVPDAWGYQGIALNFPRKMANYRPANPGQDPGPLWSAGYDGKANPLAVLYAGGNNGREPGWPAVLRLVFNVLGGSGFHTRLTSLLLGTAAAALTCAFGWRALHPAAGVVGGGLYALNVGTASNSTLGLREEVVTVVLLCLAWAAFVGARRGALSRQRALAAGLAAGALILIRADMLILAGELLAAATLVRRWPWRRAALVAGTVAALAGPMYVGFAATHRDPFYPGTYGATVNRNLEFPERHGTPGFPTPEEYAANWSSGPPISPTTYFFGYHTVPQFVAYAARGVPRIFVEFVYRNAPLRLALCVAGLGLLLVRRRWLVPFLLAVSLVPFYSFMAGAPGPMFVPRYAHHALPYAELASGAAVAALMVAWGRARGRWGGAQYQIPAWGSPRASNNLSST